MKRLVFGCAAALVAGAACGQAENDAERSAQSYVRVAESDSGPRLEVAIRRFERPDGGPAIELVSAVHIGTEEYYEQLQNLLAESDIVLFEGVGAGGPAPTEHLSDDEKHARTEQRVRQLAVMIAAFNDTAPGSLEEALGALGSMDRRHARAMTADAWGQPLVYERTGDGVLDFTLTSLGADAEPGGEGANADIALIDLEPITEEELPEDAGIQRELADALGLAFQLDAIDYDLENWRNSDMTPDQIRRSLRGEDVLADDDEEHDVIADADDDPAEPESDAEAAAEALFGMMDGSSGFAKIQGFILRLIGGSEVGRTLARLAIIEMLARADELLAAQPGGMGDLMEVLLQERNRVVMQDLERIVRDELGVGSVAVFYGAGHLADMEERLADELGYAYAGERWLTAVSVDFEDSGVPKEQADWVRSMIRTSIEAQLPR